MLWYERTEQQLSTAMAGSVGFNWIASSVKDYSPMSGLFIKLIRDCICNEKVECKAQE